MLEGGLKPSALKGASRMLEQGLKGASRRFHLPMVQPHQNRSPHHHHGAVEGSFTQKTRFGHRSSPCAHSISKFFCFDF